MRRDAFGGRVGSRRELSRAGEKSARAGKGLAARFCGPHPASRAAISLTAAPSSFSPSLTLTPTRRAPGFLGSPPGTVYDGSSSRGGPSQLPAAAPSRGGALPAAARSQRRRAPSGGALIRHFPVSLPQVISSILCMKLIALCHLLLFPHRFA